VGVGLRLLRRLPAFLRTPFGPAEARAAVAERLAHREVDLLALLRRSVYGRPASPYRILLGHAGCEPGDLARLVNREGVEGALRALYRAGVYLTASELKGREPVVRGGCRFRVDPAGLRNPDLTVHFVQHSSGSRGAVTAALLDLRSIREEALDLLAFLDAAGSAGDEHALWSIPGGTATGHLLRLAAGGIRAARWFSQVDPRGQGIHPRYRWSARIAVAGSWLAGRPLPSPRHVPVDRPEPILDWMTAARRVGRTPHLWTFASNGALLAAAAERRGDDLRGVRLTISGEPVTPGRLAAIRATGARVIPRYGASEAGIIGFGCLAPAWADDLHFLADRQAVIQPGADGGPLPPNALLLTSLRPTARLILLNASIGDQAAVVERACGCPLEALGWTRHLHSVRSEEKLTAGGMTFPDDEVIRVLEQVLPARFGGGSTDYQLWEEEGPGGRARLRLVVHPAVGPLDPAVVAEAFLAALGSGPGVERLMRLAWRDAGLVVVDRRPPERTATGKIHHLRQRRRPAAAASRSAAE
jgi:hypothetical protein